ncbi:MAG: spondin domain-containing protein [Proteobacteria bacterium]|nr:spondin domain-containing protein [Pseudomonadota bacterium]
MRRGALLAAVALPVLLAACGSSSKDTAATSSTPTTPNPVTATGAPALTQPEAQNFAQDVTITEFVIPNTGGAPNPAGGTPPGCSGANLPPGLSLNRATNGTSCSITGTPSAMAPAATVTVTAANGLGMSATTFSITITDRLPNLGALADISRVFGLAGDSSRVFTEDAAIPDIVFTNTGGAPSANDATPAGCTVDKPLPPGLSATTTEDGTSCRIIGTPNTATDTDTYTLSANNISGSSTAKVTITIPPPTRAFCAPGVVGQRNYTVTITTTWSAANNGVLPTGATIGPIFGTFHNRTFFMWQPGSLANDALASYINTDVWKSVFDYIFNNARTGATKAFIDVSMRPVGASATQSIPVTTNCGSPLATFIAKVGPSPDWFIGISRVSLLDANGQFRNNAEFPLYMYDAGTNSGTDFTSAAIPTDPPTPIVRLVGNPTIGLQAGQEQVGTAVFTFR